MAINYTKPSAVPFPFWVDALIVNNRTGVDPNLLAAISQHETNFGTLGAGRNGYELGVGVYDSGNPNSTYKGLMNQLNWAGDSIAKKFGSGVISLDSIKAYQTKSGYATDPNWAKGVWSSYQSLSKNGTGIGNTFTGIVTDPVGAVTGAVTSGASAIAGGATYVIVLLVIAGIIFYSGTKMFGNGGGKVSGNG